jgi:hypothetical protein
MAEMEPNTFTPAQNPSGIWQNIWAQLFGEFNKQMLYNNYLAAWKTVQLLKTQIPPECEEIIQDGYDHVKEIINRPTEAYTAREHINQKRAQLNRDTPEALLTLMSSIRKSLYDKKWITKENGFSGINPNVATKDL